MYLSPRVDEGSVHINAIKISPNGEGAAGIPKGFDSQKL